MLVSAGAATGASLLGLVVALWATALGKRWQHAVLLLISVAATIWLFNLVDGATTPLYDRLLGRRIPGLGIGSTAFAITVLALPPFLVTNCWLHYLGNAGVWQGWLPWRIYSLPGAAWILTLMLWPVPFLAAWSAWKGLGVGQLEADLSLRGTALFRWLLWPMAGPSAGLAFGLVFILALNNFSVPSILQVKVYSAELWIKFSTVFDYASVIRFSIPLVIAPALFLLAWRRRGKH